MKVARIKELLSEYSDDTELMVAWNDSEMLNGYENTNAETWIKAVRVYEDSEITGFGDDCRWAIQEVLNGQGEN